MLVISDASPLNILVRLGYAELLPRMYGRILIPTAVAAELNDRRAPQAIREFMTSRPDWLTIESPKQLLELDGLDEGERAALSLAFEQHADLLLIDDRRGRRAAKTLNLRMIGTIGILESAADRGLLELKAAFDRLRATDFSVSDELLDAALKRSTGAQRGRPEQS